MNEELRADNTENNCTVHSDPEGKTRPHYWRWESGESNYRYCTTCTRREWNNRAGMKEPQHD
jgi:hypothetical protein